MTDWIEHKAGDPQPVDDETWVVAPTSDMWAPEVRRAKSIPWLYTTGRYRILNQHLIDAARLEGIRLGLEAAVKMASQTIIAARTGQIGTDLRGISNVIDRDIRALDPETIAKEADQ